MEFIAHAVRVSDATLLAYAVMPNHLHLVIRQGRGGLDRIMQPLLLRIAVLVNRANRTEGHVFERRFRDRACLDPDYVRNAIVYTHLNPVRAGLVSEANAYAWTSHSLYADPARGPACMRTVIAADDALWLFAPRADMQLAELRDSYRRFLTWRMHRDRLRLEAGGGQPDSGDAAGLPPHILLSGWHAPLTPFFRAIEAYIGNGEAADRRLDLREIALQVLKEDDGGVDLEMVRSGSKARAITRARRRIVARASDAGYRGDTIARFLRVSNQCVSQILVAKRRGYPSEA